MLRSGSVFLSLPPSASPPPLTPPSPPLPSPPIPLLPPSLTPSSLPPLSLPPSSLPPSPPSLSPHTPLALHPSLPSLPSLPPSLPQPTNLPPHPPSLPPSLLLYPTLPLSPPSLPPVPSLRPRGKSLKLEWILVLNRLAFKNINTGQLKYRSPYMNGLIMATYNIAVTHRLNVTMCTGPYVHKYLWEYFLHSYVYLWEYFLKFSWILIKPGTHHAIFVFCWMQRRRKDENRMVCARQRRSSFVDFTNATFVGPIRFGPTTVAWCVRVKDIRRINWPITDPTNHNEAFSWCI